jgi:hypothetical protein
VSFDSDYLDLAIGLAVVFFLASLVVSGLNEGVAWVFRRRAKFLWAWLYDLVSPDRGLSWKPKDRRPAPGAAAAAGSPEAITRDLLHALAPVNPTGARDARTTIKHVPPSSLAQAFLEVFGDLGRTELARDLPGLLDQNPGTRRKAATRLGDLLAWPPARAAAQVTDAFATFADARASDDPAERDAAVGNLVTALEGLGGANGDPKLRDALAGFVAAEPADRQAMAEPVISSLSRLFPDVLVRQRLQASIQGLDGTPLGMTVKRMWDTATGEMDKFREQLEQWLQGELDRLGGYYKRSIRWITLVFVVAVTVVLNIDAVGVVQGLWRNPEGRSALVAYAQQAGEDTASSTSATPASGSGGDQPAPAGTPSAASLAAVRAACEQKHAPTTTTGATTTAVDPEAAAKTFTEITNCVTDAVNALSGLGVVDAALVVNAGKWSDSWTTWGWLWWRHKLGLVVTGAALFLGAPFWFDIMKRLTGARRGLVGNT